MISMQIQCFQLLRLVVNDGLDLAIAQLDIIWIAIDTKTVSTKS